jgi:hypothetical protein
MPRRGAHGRFVKSSHRRTSSRRSTSTALVRRTGGAVVIRERVSTPARRGGGRRHHHGSGGGGAHNLKTKGEVAGWASVLGYLETSKADTWEKIPTFGKLPREAVVGLVLHYFGRKHKHLDRASVAALSVAGYKIGAAGYSLTGFEE